MIGVMVRNGWPLSEILSLDFDQFELYAKDAYQAENERQAKLIMAINLGNHGKPQDIKRTISDLTEPKKRKGMSLEEVTKLPKR